MDNLILPVFMGIIVIFMAVVGYTILKISKKGKAAPAPTAAPAPVTPPAPAPTPVQQTNPALVGFLKDLGITPAPPAIDPFVELAGKFEELEKLSPGVKVEAAKVAALLRNYVKPQGS